MALFTVGINTNLRAGDLLRIKVKQARYLTPDAQGVASCAIGREQKTNKPRTVWLNTECLDVIVRLIARHNLQDDDPLFRSRKRPHNSSQTTANAITVPSLSRLVKGWCADVGLVGSEEGGGYASHSLRKTWGYFKFREACEKNEPYLMMEAFNHSDSQGQPHHTRTHPCADGRSS